MFNLIVSGKIESNQRAKITSERVFEYTDGHIIEKFKPNNELDIDFLKMHSALIMEEGRSESQLVHVARLHSVKFSYGFYVLNYTSDATFEHLSNADIFSLKEDLEMEDFEFGRNHWAIKEGDLYGILYQYVNQNKPSKVNQDKNFSSLIETHFSGSKIQLNSINHLIEYTTTLKMFSRTKDIDCTKRIITGRTVN